MCVPGAKNLGRIRRSQCRDTFGGWAWPGLICRDAEIPTRDRRDAGRGKGMRHGVPDVVRKVNWIDRWSVLSDWLTGKGVTWTRGRPEDRQYPDHGTEAVGRCLLLARMTND